MSAPDTPSGGIGRITGAKERLQRIGRHFLSDEAETRRIAVLAAADTPHALPPAGLARALAGRGRSVAVIDAGAGMLSLTAPCPAAPGMAAGRTSTPDPGDALARLHGRPPDFLFLWTPPAAAIASCDLVLLTVPTHARGLRAAYLELKACARLGRIPPVGVTLTDAPDREAAAAAFSRFAAAAQRFLGLAVASYSFLAAKGAHGDIAAALDDIAHLLLEDVRESRRSRDDAAAAVPTSTDLRVEEHA